VTEAEYAALRRRIVHMNPRAAIEAVNFGDTDLKRSSTSAASISTPFWISIRNFWLTTIPMPHTITIMTIVIAITTMVTATMTTITAMTMHMGTRMITIMIPRPAPIQTTIMVTRTSLRTMTISVRLFSNPTSPLIQSVSKNSSVASFRSTDPTFCVTRVSFT